MVRELTLTNLEYSPTRLATREGGTCLTLGASRGMPASLVPRTVSFEPKPRSFGSRLVVVLAGAPYRVFRFTLQGYKSINYRPLIVI
jgi:hypothetical protein